LFPLPERLGGLLPFTADFVPAAILESFLLSSLIEAASALMDGDAGPCACGSRRPCELVVVIPRGSLTSLQGALFAG
jgi:hypothetical protein